MAIPYVDVKAQYAPLIPELKDAFAQTLESGRFIFGPEVEAFEREAADLLGVQDTVSCANGTDALVLVLDAMEIGPGDEVVCPAFTFYATAESIARRGATPVLADIDPVSLNLDPADVERRITPRTKALMPVHLFGRPAPDLSGFIRSAPAALGLLLLNYLWVARSGVVPEEGALAAARSLEEMKEAHRGGRLGRARPARTTPAPFRLAPTGRPEVALLWKNLIGSLRNIGGMRTFLWLIAVCLLPALMTMVVHGRGFEVISQVLGVMCAMTAMSLLLVGPSILRSDFRQDLLHIDLLKTYPMSGHSLLVGTLLAPVMMLTLIEWALFAGFAILTTSSFGEVFPGRSGPTALALTGAILALPMNMVAALIHNAALLLIPGWVTLGPTRTTGVERIGQGMIATLGFLLAMALSVVPAAAIFGIAWFFGSYFVGAAAALPVSALPATLVLLAEAWVGAALLGAYLDRFDPSRELDSITRTYP